MAEAMTAGEWFDGEGYEGHVSIVDLCEEVEPGYGLTVASLTAEQFEALRDGKALEIGVMGEYCLLLCRKEVERG